MAREKEIWYTMLSGVGMHLNGRGYYRVHVSMNLRRDPSRRVQLAMRPERARELAQSLLKYAEHVEKLNAGI